MAVTPKEELEVYDNYKKIKNIALFGIDSADGIGRSDSTMIATIDPVHDKLKITSIMRDSYVNIDGYGYDKLNDTISFDEEKAKKILDDAKIVDSNKDGYRELDGKNIELNFLTYDSRNLTDFAEGVALQLEKIGIKVNVKKTDADTEWNMLVSGEYDLLNTNWMTVQDGNPYGYLDNWYGKSNANYCRISK